MKFNRKLAGAGVASIAVLVLSGCAGGASDPQSSVPSADVERVSLTIGVLPIADTSPVQIAIDEGFFDEEELDVEIQFFNTSSAIVPGIVNGDVNFAATPLITSFNALAQNVPIVSVAPNIFSDVGENDVTSIMVPADSDIQSLEDLPGRTMSIVGLQSYAHMLALGTLDKAGVDAESVDFVEVAFPDVGGAFAADRLDASVVNEPFRTALLDQGAREIARPVTEVFETPIQSQEWITSESYLAESPDVVDRFRRAILKANAVLIDDRDAARTAVLEMVPTLDAGVVERMALPYWTTETDADSYERFLDAMRTYIDFQGEVDLEEYLRVSSGS